MLTRCCDDPTSDAPWSNSVRTSARIAFQLLLHFRRHMAQPDSLAAKRTLAAPLLTNAPADAVASYFALEHDPKRTRLTVRTNAAGRALAFVAVCQTGLDLFRPLVVLRGDDASVVQEALREALQPRRQYLFNALPSARPDMEAAVDFHGEAIHIIYVLSAADFQPVSLSQDPHGLICYGRLVERRAFGSDNKQIG